MDKATIQRQHDSQEAGLGSSFPALEENHEDKKMLSELW